MIKQIISDLSVAQYEALEAMRMSRLKVLSHSALLYQYRLTHPKFSNALRLGDAAHCAVLEPQRFVDEYVVWTERTKDGKKMASRSGPKWVAFQEANAGKRIITEKEFTAAYHMNESIRANNTAKKYLVEGEPEVSMLWECMGRQAKGRVDWVTAIKYPGARKKIPTLVGLKTARDVREFPFSKQAAGFGYHLHWAYYFDGYTAITGTEPRMIEIVVESGEGPHDLIVYEIPNEIILQGREEYIELFKRLDECEQANEWPGLATAEQVLTFPTWAYKQSYGDDLSALGLDLEVEKVEA